jgi:hypothetical protein
MSHKTKLQKSAIESLETMGLPNITVKQYLDSLSEDERKIALLFLDRGEKRGSNTVCDFVEFEP